MDFRGHAPPPTEITRNARPNDHVETRWICMLFTYIIALAIMLYFYITFAAGFGLWNITHHDKKESHYTNGRERYINGIVACLQWVVSYLQNHTIGYIARVLSGQP